MSTDAPRQPRPSWEPAVIDSPRAMLCSVALEGIERLVLTALAKEVMLSRATLQGVVSKQVLLDLEIFCNAAFIEIAQVAVLLGAALASTPVSPLAPDFEAWLSQAVNLAGLEDYEIVTRYREPTRE